MSTSVETIYRVLVINATDRMTQEAWRGPYTECREWVEVEQKKSCEIERFFRIVQIPLSERKYANPDGTPVSDEDVRQCQACGLVPSTALSKSMRDTHDDFLESNPGLIAHVLELRNVLRKKT
jgi:hypothetical protein